MGGKGAFSRCGWRGLISGCAVMCYGAALVIGAAATRLPAPRSAASAPDAPAQTAADTQPAIPQTAPPIVENGEDGPERSNRPSEVSDAASREADLFLRAQTQRQAGDLKGAEEAYLRLYRKGIRRDEAARNLGAIYAQLGDYSRAEEMYRESARILREKRK